MDEVLKAFLEKRAHDKISDFHAGVLIQKRAEHLGLTLAEYLATPAGHAANQEFARVRRLQQEYDSAVGDGYSVAKKLEMADTSETRPGFKHETADSTLDQRTDDDADKELEEPLNARHAKLGRGKACLTGNPKNPASEQPDQPEPDAEEMEGQEDAKGPRPVLAKVAKIMKRENVSFDVAISRLHRMETRAKGFSPATW